MRHTCQREGVILDTEVDDPRSIAAEIRDRRVVSVEHQSCIPFAQRLLPALNDRLELAVAVELIAKQVSEQDRARLQLRGERAEPELVDLEQTGLAGDRAARKRGGQQRGGDAAGHVCSALVVYEPDAVALEDRAGEGSGVRLAVGRRDQHAAASQTRGERRNRIRLHPQKRLAGSACGAAAAPARERTHGPRERELDGQRVRHQPALAGLPDGEEGAVAAAGACAKGELVGARSGVSIVIAAGSARTRTGSSPMGSPSAYIANGRSQLIVISFARCTCTPGWCTCSPLKTLGRMPVRNPSLPTSSTSSTSSRPSSSSASGAAIMPPP